MTEDHKPTRYFYVNNGDSHLVAVWNARLGADVPGLTVIERHDDDRDAMRRVAFLNAGGSNTGNAPLVDRSPTIGGDLGK
jgi:hypothetical protein